MECLIIVDVQNDFIDGSLPVPDGEKVVPIINKIKEKFNTVFFTYDWHPENHISFYSSHKDQKPYTTIKVDDISVDLWPVHAIQNTWGAELHKDLIKN